MIGFFGSMLLPSVFEAKQKKCMHILLILQTPTNGKHVRLFPHRLEHTGVRSSKEAGQRDFQMLKGHLIQGRLFSMAKLFWIIMFLLSHSIYRVYYIGITNHTMLQ